MWNLGHISIWLNSRTTRTGARVKILRGTIKKIADGEPWTMPVTIDDPVILDAIGEALKRHRVGHRPA
jgi:hypothetical protein